MTSGSSSAGGNGAASPGGKNPSAVAGSIDPGGPATGGAFSVGGAPPTAGSTAVGGTPQAGAGQGGGVSSGGVSPGGSGNDGGDPNVAGQGGAGGNPPELECSCAAGKACVRLTVRRAADTSRQPWVLWPDRADGVGNLRVSAYSPSFAFHDRATVSNVSLVAVNSSTQVAICVPPGKTNVRAFLDDNEDEDANAYTSSDYLDSCSSGDGTCVRCYGLDVTAGSEKDLTIELAHSCD